MGFLKFNEFTQNLYRYIEARLELAKVEAEDRIGRAVALLLQLTLLVVLLGSMFLFLMIALSLYINTFAFCAGAPYMGFLVVAGGHFAIILVAMMLRGSLLSGTKRWLQKSLQQFINYVIKDK